MNTGAAGVIHNDNTLGAIATYPGVDEVMSTAIDPLAGIYRSGLMWFDQRNGIATRGFDQVEGIKDQDRPPSRRAADSAASRSSASRRPSRSATACGWMPISTVARMRTSPPSTARSSNCGRPMPMATAGTLVGTRTTSTINGQPGTYYFRTDDPDVIADPNNPTKPVFVPNAKYILVFKPGNGTGPSSFSSPVPTLCTPASPG